MTWVFFFLYGPVEVALPVYVAVDLRAPAGLLGAYWTTFGVGALAATLITGTIRGRNMRRITLLIVAGWGACLLPFAFAPIPVTLAAFAIGGLIYGPFIPLTYALFQSSTTAANLPSVLAARSAVVMVSTPLGTAIGGPLVGTPRRVGDARGLRPRDPPAGRRCQPCCGPGGGTASAPPVVGHGELLRSGPRPADMQRDALDARDAWSRHPGCLRHPRGVR